jgi:hypothetical protein
MVSHNHVVGRNALGEMRTESGAQGLHALNETKDPFRPGLGTKYLPNRGPNSLL